MFPILIQYNIFQVCDDYNSARHHYEEIDNDKYKVILFSFPLIKFRDERVPNSAHLIYSYQYLSIQIFHERLNSLRAALKANKLVKPHPSPLPPPPQSFSDSPRKRRGRGYLSSTSATLGQVTGTNAKRNETTQRRLGSQNKLLTSGIFGSFTNYILIT